MHTISCFQLYVATLLLSIVHDPTCEDKTLSLSIASVASSHKNRLLL